MTTAAEVAKVAADTSMVEGEAVAITTELPSLHHCSHERVFFTLYTQKKFAFRSIICVMIVATYENCVCLSLVMCYPVPIFHIVIL